MPEHLSSFIQDLSFADHMRLRKITRHIMATKWNRPDLTDVEVDRLIEAIGPRTQERLLKEAVDNRLVG